MAALSDYLEENILNHIFRTGSYTKPTTLAFALLTTAAQDDDTGTFTTGTGVEVVDDYGYVRQTLNPSDSNWSNPSAGTQGQTDNLAKITFPTASGGSWGLIVGIAIVDDSDHDSGNMLWHGTLTIPKQIDDGDTFEINIGDIDCSLD